MLHDCASLWLLDILPVKHPLFHSSIYGHAVRMCCKYTYCACALPGTARQSKLQDVT